jgi:hypothetical protein
LKYQGILLRAILGVKGSLFHPLSIDEFDVFFRSAAET